MKFGVREICDVVLKAKATQDVGNKRFYRGEPVIYFDTLKTSGMEGAATTVYAQGGRGNARLMAWEGERTVTFTMEDALISPEGFMILSGAGLIEGGDTQKVYQHVTEQISDSKKIVLGDSNKTLTITLKEHAYLPTDLTGEKENYIYVMLLNDGEIVSEPYIATKSEGKNITIQAQTTSTIAGGQTYTLNPAQFDSAAYDAVLVDYYVEKGVGAKQIEITPDKFGGNYYLEASTLFRDTNGVDYPAEFIIPNCKIQSNFNFTMASSGDPSTFTFTMDAFPDYTKFDKSKKVLAAIQIIDEEAVANDEFRKATVHAEEDVSEFSVNLNNGGYDTFKTAEKIDVKIGEEVIAKASPTDGDSAADVAGKMEGQGKYSVTYVKNAPTFNVKTSGPKIPANSEVRFLKDGTETEITNAPINKQIGAPVKVDPSEEAGGETGL